MRSDNPAAKERVAAIWTENDPQAIAAILAATERLPAANTKPYHAQIHEMITDKRTNVRQAAISAVGHLADPADVPALLTAGKRYADRSAVADALARFHRTKSPDQLVPAAQILADETAGAQKSDPARYGRLLASAVKYVSDARIPKDQASKWVDQLRQTGVLLHYLRSGAIPVPADKSPFAAVYPPEQNCRRSLQNLHRRRQHLQLEAARCDRSNGKYCAGHARAQRRVFRGDI